MMTNSILFKLSLFPLYLKLIISTNIFALTGAVPVELAYSCVEITTNEEDKLNPVILLHGLGTSRNEWMGIYQVLALETKRKVCITDARNHGDSPWSDDMSLQDLSDDIIHFMNRMKIPKATLIGHSMGGQAAVMTALQNPDRVEKLVVEDMRPSGVEPQALQMVKRLVTLMQDSISAVAPGSTEEEAKLSIRDYVNKHFDPFGRAEALSAKRTESLPIQCENGTCRWKTNFKVILKALEDPESVLITNVGSFPGKALFIYGSKSPFKVGEDAENIWNLFPNAKLVEVEGATHEIHSKNPQFLEEILKFLS